jgi:hypothetical protein
MGKRLVIWLLLLLTGCNLTSTDPATNNEVSVNNPNAINYYVLLPGDNGANGTPVSCEDSAVGITTGQEWTPDVANNLEVALRSLMNNPNPTVNGQPYTNYWAGRDIRVDSVEVTGDAATIALSSPTQQILLSGVCYDGALQSQLLMTVFQNQALASAYITYNGQNVRQMFDASGLVTASEPYTRAALNLGADPNAPVPATPDPTLATATP